ncbi:MAG: DUF1893 domain-containing protein [Lachnospiraceae bacterium]|nr:DUF1893 domain-containing protein [Lachnospiraceae bacterium]
MNKNLIEAKELLDANDYTCVIMSGKSLYTSRERGVKPLLAWVNEGVDFAGFFAADKVVGKAAAFLYVLLKVEAVYAKIISAPAVQVLDKHDIQVFYEEKVEAIRNRTNTGFCPMEKTVWEIENPKEALEAIRKKASELSNTTIL